MSHHARRAGILVQMAAIIGVGAAIGVVDALMYRPVDLSEREKPIDLTEALKNQQARPVDSGETKPAPAPGDIPRPGPVDAPPTPTPATTTAAPATTPAGFTFTPKAALPAGHITIEEAKIAYDAGAVFVDSRSKEHFEELHVLNAIRIDTKMFEAGDPPELGLIPRSSVVIVYCKGGNCDESDHLAKYLSHSGYKTVYVMHDGIPGWQAAGHPTATGE